MWVEAEVQECWAVRWVDVDKGFGSPRQTCGERLPFSEPCQ